MSTVEHAHQRLLFIDAREHYDDRCVGDDQVQVVFGEVKVDRLKASMMELFHIEGLIVSILYMFEY